MHPLYSPMRRRLSSDSLGVKGRWQPSDRHDHLQVLFANEEPHSRLWANCQGHPAHKHELHAQDIYAGTWPR